MYSKGSIEIPCTFFETYELEECSVHAHEVTGEVWTLCETNGVNHVERGVCLVNRLLYLVVHKGSMEVNPNFNEFELIKAPSENQNKQGDILETTGDTTFNLSYWDCDCEKEFIHPLTLKLCSKCGVYQKDSPSSIEIEVQKLIYKEN